MAFSHSGMLNSNEQGHCTTVRNDGSSRCLFDKITQKYNLGYTSHAHTYTHTTYAATSQGSSIVSTRGNEMALMVFLNLGANHTNIFSL